MLVGQIVAGKFAQPEQTPVARNRIKAHAPAKLFKNVLFECASASVKFMYFRRPTLSMVSRVMTFSSSAATAMVGLIVEQGIYPSLKAIF